MRHKAMPDLDALCEPAEVHQATGMISAHLGISCRDALARLRRYAATAGIGHLEVAEATVERRLHLHHFHSANSPRSDSSTADTPADHAAHSINTV
ncbi:hypothetical protein AD006_21280 [Pseudonocardia sp. EC080610-09]|nr:hypothetical protein FRP1_13605 [Pseudonocardia sp. EC080625-04]ALL77212.1 hypothetical protein AD006_21280 [Pseudonocardia sp. EC080610-09]ALL80127.1 hypothetical protein AD017_00860 [Pseudonocardia sp. EC080619-01]